MHILKLLTYLRFLTDDFGVWQHTKGKAIDRSKGYALDDSARALIVYLEYGDLERAGVCLNYIAASRMGDTLALYCSKGRKPNAQSYSEDAHALAIWALATAIKKDFCSDQASALYKAAHPERLLRKTGYLRTVAYLLIAFCAVGDAALARKAADRLQKAFDPKLGWFENRLTYANAILPYALLRYRRTFGSTKGLDATMHQSLRTLQLYCYIGAIPAPIGNRQWQKIGEFARDVYGQQAIDAAFMVMLLSEAAKAYGAKPYRAQAKEWLDWFTGNNIFRASLIDNRFAVADGLDDPARPDGGGVSPNHGSESTIVYLLARAAYDHK